MRPAIACGIVTWDAPVSYWSMFFPVPYNSPRSLGESQFGPVFFSFLMWRMFNEIQVTLIQKRVARSKTTTRSAMSRVIVQATSNPSPGASEKHSNQSLKMQWN